MKELGSSEMRLLRPSGKGRMPRGRPACGTGLLRAARFGERDPGQRRRNLLRFSVLRAPGRNVAVRPLVRLPTCMRDPNGGSLNPTMNAISSILTGDAHEAIAAAVAGARFVIFHGPCATLMRALPSESVGLFVTSPPYFMGKAYDRSYKIDDFRQDIASIASDCVRVTKNNGSICWQVGYHVNKTSVMPLDFLIHEVFRNFPDIFLRNRIVWTFGHGTHAKRRFSGRHETILWYGKGEDYLFDLDSIRVPQKYPGKKHYKGPNRGKYSSHPTGKNPSDVWDIPNVKSNHCEKTAHPCQFPVALVQRLVRSLTLPGALVFDPFSGSGSSGIAAVLEGRSFLGCDTSKEYCEIALKRFRSLEAGELALRPLEREIYVPSGREAVAKRPENVEFHN